MEPSPNPQGELAVLGQKYGIERQPLQAALESAVREQRELDEWMDQYGREAEDWRKMAEKLKLRKAQMHDAVRLLKNEVEWSALHQRSPSPSCGQVGVPPRATGSPVGCGKGGSGDSGGRGPKEQPTRTRAPAGRTHKRVLGSVGRPSGCPQSATHPTKGWSRVRRCARAAVWGDRCQGEGSDGAATNTEGSDFSQPSSPPARSTEAPRFSRNAPTARNVA